jgi:hypothetical protein
MVRALLGRARGALCATVRAKSTEAGDHSDAIKRMAAEAAANIEKGAEALKARYDDRGGVMMWVTEYYRHREHKFTIPALMLMCEDERQLAMPSVVVKNAVFFSTLLRGLPADAASQYCAAMTMVPGLPMEIMLAIVHGAGTPVTGAVYDRLGASLRRSGNRDLLTAAQHIASVPPGPASSWPAPWEAKGGMGAAMGVRGAWRAPSTLYPWELLPAFSRARSATDTSFHDWLLLASTTHLEAQWAELYATGSRLPLHRVVQAAAGWAEFAPTLPDSVDFLTNMSAPLPEELVGAGKAPGASSEEAARSVRAVVSRAAAWSLLTFSRRHPVVFEAVAAACVPLAPWFADASVRAEEAEARGPGQEGSGDGEVLTEAEADARLNVLPGLLHLMASVRAQGRANAEGEGQQGPGSGRKLA